jgi:hypothetical protein
MDATEETFTCTTSDNGQSVNFPLDVRRRARCANALLLLEPLQWVFATLNSFVHHARLIIALSAVCARPWEAARCVLPEGTLPQECSGCTPHRQGPAGGAPRRPLRERGTPPRPRGRTCGPRGMLSLGEPGATLQGRTAGAVPRASEVGSPWPRRITPAHNRTGGR